MYNLKLIFITILLISTYQVNAVVLTGESTGSFLVESSGTTDIGNPIPGEPVLGTAGLAWGTGTTIFEAQSSLKLSNESNIGINTGQAFKISDLIYHNGRIQRANTNLTPKPKPFVFEYTAVDLVVNLDYSKDGSSLGNYDFKMGLMVLESDNMAAGTGGTGAPTSSDKPDVVFIDLASNDNSVISIDGIDYVFELLGFGNGGDYDLSFSQGEGSGSTVGIYAKLTAVPLPSAAILLVTAFSGLFISVNRRGKKIS